jgi:hypothetical protein
MGFEMPFAIPPYAGVGLIGLCHQLSIGAGMGKDNAASLRTETLEMRVTLAEKETLRDAADRAGLALSTWSRMLLLREAKAT